MTSEKELLREYYCDTVPLCLICSIGFLLLSLIVYMPEKKSYHLLCRERLENKNMLVNHAAHWIWLDF